MLGPGIDGAGDEGVGLISLERSVALTGVDIDAFFRGPRGLSLRGSLPSTMVDGLRATAATYRGAYRLAPARQLLAAAQGHMQLALSLRPGDQPEPARVHLLTCLGEMAALSGAILGLDLGTWPRCVPYLNLAERAARECGNTELRAVVMACHAFRAALQTARDLELAREFGEAARALALRGGSPITRAWTAAVASERHAELGEANGCWRLLDEARDALDGEMVDEFRYSGIGTFDGAKLIAYEGGNYRRLGRFNKAIAVLDTALVRLDPDMHRHRATALIDRAEARRDARQFDAACADALAALDLVADTQHAGTLDRVLRLARTMRRTGREANELWNHALAASTQAYP
jgi:tetratricopeptide (TPR) repeat protein